MSSISGLSSTFSLMGGTSHQSFLQSNSKGTAGVFAANIMRRAQPPAHVTGVEGTPPAAANGATPPQTPAVDEKALALTKKLEQALADTVTYMADKYGSAAGTAMMGIVYKRLGSGEVNENTLGSALLDVTRFVDSQFGFDEGDAFLSQLNDDLNKNLNAYFDNGKNEVFFAGPVMPSSPQGTSIEMGGLSVDEQDSDSDPTAIIQKTVKGILGAINSMREQTQHVKKLPANIAKELLQYTQQTSGSPLPPGLVTDAVV